MESVYQLQNRKKKVGFFVFTESGRFVKPVVSFASMINCRDNWFLFSLPFTIHSGMKPTGSNSKVKMPPRLDQGKAVQRRQRRARSVGKAFSYTVVLHLLFSRPFPLASSSCVDYYLVASEY